MTLARTAATAAGAAGLHPDVLAFSSSLQLDLSLFTEDVVGNLAHLSMLKKVGLLSGDDAESLRDGLVALWSEGPKALPQDEEDVHMAIEAELLSRVGDSARRLHTARSRNDQVALDLRLHVREQTATILQSLSEWLSALAARAEADRDILFPAYTHRQRAMPVSVGYWWCSYAAMFARDVEAFRYVASQVDVCALGVGAIAGTSLPIDREYVQRRLAFSKLSMNGLDTVGDRDFVLDYTHAVTKLLLHASRLATDVIDFATQEFGFLTLDGSIACGSSMMPQKKNPDVFELIRGKSARAIGNHTSLLATIKGLPGGYLRDLQEDRGPLLDMGRLSQSVLSILRLSLSRIAFNSERCRSALTDDYTQATDLAEALVTKGVPFRQAYQAVGALVTHAKSLGLPLGQVTAEQARAINELFVEDVLMCLDVLRSVERKKSTGSTGPASVAAQIEEVKRQAKAAGAFAQKMPRLQALFEALKDTW